MRLAVGIPSYQEADTIGHVVAQADRGLARLQDRAECFIVNVDGDSPDGTGEVFRATATICAKVSLSVTARPGGKGCNVLRLLEYCRERDVTALALIDADVSSVTPDWVDGLLGPIIGGTADLVAPLYRRTRFDGATTNHLAYPVMYGYGGVDLRQPIAGDFGLSPRLIEYLLRQPVDDAVRDYGIDIFMSLHAAGAGFKLCQAPLGRKLHKPSFPKWPRIIQSVAGATVGVLRRFPPKVAGAPPSLVPSIDDNCEYRYQAEAKACFQAWRIEALRLIPTYQNWLGERSEAFVRTVESRTPQFTSAVWVALLAAWVAHVVRHPREAPAQTLAAQIRPAAVMRGVTFWHQQWHRAAGDVEREIMEQAWLFRQQLLGRLDIRS